MVNRAERLSAVTERNSIMRMLLLAAAASLTLAGCLSTPFTSSQLAYFQKTCAAGRTAYTVFSTLKDTGKFSARTIQIVDGTWAGVNGLCVNPPADISTAAVQVAAALVVINKAIDNG